MHTTTTTTTTAARTADRREPRDSAPLRLRRRGASTTGTLTLRLLGVLVVAACWMLADVSTTTNPDSRLLFASAQTTPSHILSVQMNLRQPYAIAGEHVVVDWKVVFNATTLFGIAANYLKNLASGAIPFFPLVNSTKTANSSTPSTTSGSTISRRERRDLQAQLSGVPPLQAASLLSSWSQLIDWARAVMYNYLIADMIALVPTVNTCIPYADYHSPTEYSGLNPSSDAFVLSISDWNVPDRPPTASGTSIYAVPDVPTPANFFLTYYSPSLNRTASNMTVPLPPWAAPGPGFYSTQLPTVTLSTTKCYLQALDAISAVQVPIMSRTLPIPGSGGNALYLSSLQRYPTELAQRNMLRGSNSLANALAPIVVYDSGSCVGADRPLLLKAFTAELWFRASAPDKQGLPDKQCCWPLLSTTGVNGFDVSVITNNTVQFLTPFLGGSCGTIPGSRVGTTSSLLDQQWHHIAVTYSSNVKTIYVDGILTLSLQCSGSAVSLDSTRLSIGRSFTGDQLDENFDGTVDEIRIWSVARSGPQILATLHRTLRIDEMADIVMYYNFDERLELLTNIDYTGSANSRPATIRDRSPKQRDIVMGAETAGTTFDLRHIGRYVISSAPLAGARQSVLFKVSNPPAQTGGGQVDPNDVRRDGPELFQDVTFVTFRTSPFQLMGRLADAQQSPLTGTSRVAIASVPTWPFQLEFANGTVLKGPVPTDANPRWFLQSEKFVISYTNSLPLPENIPRVTVKFFVVDPTTQARSAYGYVAVDNVHNTAPTVGTAGGMLHCTGNSFALAQDFALPTQLYGNVRGTSPYTIEWWGYFFAQEMDGVVYSFASDVDGQWCNNPGDCFGRFMASVPGSSGGAEIYDGWNVTNSDGYVSVASSGIRPLFGAWNHFAITSDGGLDGGVASFYVNGKVVQVRPSFGSQADVLGLYVCHWPFWGDDFFYRGLIDNLRVWSGVQPPEALQAYKDGAVPRESQHLLAQWTFDPEVTIDETIDLDDLPTDADALVSAPSSCDISRFNNRLVFGACTPNTQPYCRAGDGQCAFNQPLRARPCFVNDTRDASDGVLDGVMASLKPRLLMSTAPIGGYTSPVLALQGQNTTVTLTGADPDGDPLQFIIVGLPHRGQLFTVTGLPITVANGTLPIGVSTVVYRAPVSSGGINLTSFTYTISDGYVVSTLNATVRISVACAAGRRANPSTLTCELCSPGTYRPEPSFKTFCLPTQLGYYQPQAGASAQLTCPPGHFQDEPSSASCKLCVEYNDPAPCIVSNDLAPRQANLLVTLSGLHLVVCFICLVLVFALRKTKVIHSSSPLFLATLLVGICVLSVDTLLASRVQTAAFCTARLWLFNLGFMIAMGALFSKLWRLRKLKNNCTLRAIKLSNSEVLVPVLIFVLVDCLILGVWTGIAPFHLRSEYDHECVSDEHTSFLVVMLCIKGALVVYCCYLAFVTRNVLCAYNESQYIALSVYATLLAGLVIYSIIFALTSVVHPRTILLLEVHATLFVTTVVFFLIFLPKALRIAGLYKQSASISTLFATINKTSYRGTDVDLDDSTKTDTSGSQAATAADGAGVSSTAAGAAAAADGAASVVASAARLRRLASNRSANESTQAEAHAQYLARLERNLERKELEQQRQVAILAMARKHQSMAVTALRLSELEVQKLRLELEWQRTASRGAVDTRIVSVSSRGSIGSELSPTEMFENAAHEAAGSDSSSESKPGGVDIFASDVSALDESDQRSVKLSRSSSVVSNWRAFGDFPLDDYHQSSNV
ncbi:hypothetical protein CAOG_04237 [Capsaspora owczarzaki ATCC 30864]|uniref:G-protein coupled receptors family 3 profile domain-containing protein n=1 Tax=Capsaspora owczarzaki (strain ATCC 30864) TaxID=595528 RepID=A0A0D2WPQ0_CAPO3|nr:hypothetical protein CAOG_04237 [Capsaspora owczarzaki ATCC 30864]KJE93445.1 hypothetical protein CAOG_004237 [Capsaspora owczarzaki ATCC 30864]|eukprot:XP_004348062.2 hypothetical protein CAOG_04237 [Capsaspora owczarzaki ATCC 30864]